MPCLKRGYICLFTGVLPFGNTNSFASRVFPVGELEVERFCQATMAVIQNRSVIV